MTKPEPVRVYWDSAAFVAFLKSEPQRVDKCRDVLNAAEQGEITICTSALTLTEVIRGRNHRSIDQTAAAEVSSLFASSFIEVYGLDRSLAERARDLCWACGTSLRGNDAIHIVTAQEAEVAEFHSFNGRLNRLQGLAKQVAFVLIEPRIRSQVLPFKATSSGTGGARQAGSPSADA